MMPVVLALVVLGLAALLVYAAVTTAKQRAREREETWSALAARRGGTVTAGLLEAEIDGALLRLGSEVYGSGKSARQTTYLRASFVVGCGPEFVVYEEGVMPDRADVELAAGSKFDERYVVHTREPEATRAAFGARARKAITACAATPSVRSDGRFVTVRFSEEVTELAVLDPLFDAVANLARASLDEAIDPLLRLDGVRLHAASGPFDARVPPRAEIDTPHGIASIGPRPRDGRLSRSVWARNEIGVPPLSVAIGSDGAVLGDLPRGVLPAEAAESLHRVGEGVLEADEHEVRFTWRASSEAPQIVAAAALVCAIAAGAGRGPFR